MTTTVNYLVKHNKLLLVFVVLTTVFLSIKLGNVEMREDEETFISAQSTVLKQYRDYQQTFESNEGVIVAFESHNIFDPAELEYLDHLQGKLENLPGVKEVKSLLNADNITGTEDGLEIEPVINRMGMSQKKAQNPQEIIRGNPLFEGVFISSNLAVSALIIDLPGMFNGGSDSLHKSFYNELERIIIEEEMQTGRRLHIGGDIVTDAAIERLMDKDLSLLFPLSLLLSALILFIFYRKGITTIIPLIPVVIAIVWVVGLKGWTDIPMTPVSITLFPLITVIGLANSIHIINYYQRFRPAEKSGKDAASKTLMAVLKPCFLAAFTTAVGFGSLAVSSVTGIRQMGLFAAFGIMSAFTLSITIIPFALQRSNLFTTFSSKKSLSNPLDPVLKRINSINQNHPWKVIILFTLLTIVLAINIPRIKVEGSMASFARENTRIRQDIQFLDQNMSGINSFELIIKGEGDAFKQPKNLAKLDSIENLLLSKPNVLKVFSICDLVKTINKALHADSSENYTIPKSTAEVTQYLFLYEISGGEELSSFVDESYSTARMTIRTCQLPNKEQKMLLDQLKGYTNNKFSDFDITITGSGVLMNHVNKSLISTQVESVLMALAIILILMFLMFGFKGGILSILPNLFPIVAFMGLMGIFGIDLNMATSIIAAVTIGIVVDDTIHFFFGYKKEMIETNNPSLAVTNTISKVGAALCVTSIVLSLGFGILVFSSSKFIGDFGIMSASAIVAALLGDLFISPIALLKSKLFKNN